MVDWRKFFDRMEPSTKSRLHVLADIMPVPTGITMADLTMWLRNAQKAGVLTRDEFLATWHEVRQYRYLL